ncbi:isoleucine--tRNA ligase [bacterium]|nr:isoleucine--tRNA ligase [bacterium]
MKKTSFPVPNVRSFYDDVEQPILKFWQENKIFEKSVEQRPESNHFVFYDGPPFVTGMPHYGHLLASVLKDMVPRYQTMKGKRVERLWGWDCHGIAVEEMVERKFKTKNRREIEENIGVKQFIEACADFVKDTSGEWEWYIDRIARWVDMKKPYRTMDLNYMETVMWVFKQFYEKGLVYKGKRVSMYCTRCGTPMSNFEIAMDNSYRDLEDPSVFAKFPITGQDKTYIVAWTTTPWTLPANSALVVNKEAEYVTCEVNGEKLIVAKELAEKVFAGMEYKVVDTFTGEKLLGLSYTPLFDYFAPNEKDNKVYHADFVSMTDGTGIIHMAPGFGEDDTALGKEIGLSMHETIDEEGKLIPEVRDYAGKYFKDADPFITEDLTKRGLMLKAERITHSYPVCWRCSTPLVYKAQDSWYVNIQQVKDQLFANNEKINWVPEHIKHGRFEDAIKTFPDWGISRTRYWATPLPIWECDSCNHREVLGSIAEIEERSGKKVTDLHRPYIDEHTYTCKECGKGTMKRVEEVVDCWLESASMPFAQFHYPFENKEKFEKNFPGDFIIEYVGQTRAWFNVMHTVSTLLFQTNAFKNVICTGTINGTDGRKMSKSLGNYPDPRGTIEKYGGDSFRIYIAGSVLPLGEDLDVSEEAIAAPAKEVLLPLMNTYKYFTLYANQHEFEYNSEFVTTNLLDKWVLARVKKALKSVDENFSNYLLPKAIAELKPLIDDISTWYIRRSRDRFVAGDNDSLQTLFRVLLNISKIFAPVAPFITEHLYQSLKLALPTEQQLESVHLELFPEVESLTEDEERLLADMEMTRKAASLGQSIRVEKAIALKQPLSKLFYKGEHVLTQEHLDIVAEELNVQEVEAVTEMPTSKFVASKEDQKIAVGLDTEITSELAEKGLLREVTRAVQAARKTATLEIGQKANIQFYSEDEALNTLIEKYKGELSQATLLNSVINVSVKPEGNKVSEATVGAEKKILTIKIV